MIRAEKIVDGLYMRVNGLFSSHFPKFGMERLSNFGEKKIDEHLSHHVGEHVYTRFTMTVNVCVFI